MSPRWWSPIARMSPRWWSPILLLASVAAAATDAPESRDGDGVDVNLLFSTPEGDRNMSDVEVAPLVAACVAFVFGTLLCFAGHRVLRYAALGCAFFDGAFATSALLASLLKHMHWDGVVSWVFFFLGGIVCCLLVLGVKQGDVICVGITAGFITAFTCLTTVGYLIAPTHPYAVLYALLVVLGLLSGFLTLKAQPVSLAPATSWIGSNMITWGVGYFFGDYPNATTIAKFRDKDGTYHLPSAWWGYLAGALICFLVGTIVQISTFRFPTKTQRRRQRPITRRNAATPQRELQDDVLRRYISVQTPSTYEHTLDPFARTPQIV